MNQQTQSQSITQYTSDIPPAYKIIIQPTKEDPENPIKHPKRIYPINIARLITPLLPNNTIDEIKNSGRNKIAVITQNTKIAKKILTLNVLKINKLETIIPSCYIYSQVIIKNIPVDITEQEIFENLQLVSPVENLAIHSIRRFNRSIKQDSKVEYVPSTTVMITYRGRVLPQHVLLYRVRYSVEHYKLNTII